MRQTVEGRASRPSSRAGTPGSPPASMLREAVGLTHRANMRLLIDKQPACGERLAVNFPQSEHLHLVVEHAQGSSGSQTLGLFQQRPQHYDVGYFGRTEFVGALRGRNCDHLHFGRIKVGGQAGAVVKNDSAAYYLSL